MVGDMFYHPMNKSGKGAQYLFAGGSGKIYPDFIGKDAENRIIADAKYKPIRNISGDDYLQILAYMLRFEAKSGYYFYPEQDISGDQKLFLNTGTTYDKNVTRRDDVFVMKHGLLIPNAANDYNDFAEKMTQSEAVFTHSIAAYMNNE